MQNVLLGLEGNAQITAARSVAANAMTVRQTEALVKKLQSPSPPNRSRPQTFQPDIMRLQEELCEKLGAVVSIQHSAKGAGKLILSTTASMSWMEFSPI